MKALDLKIVLLTTVLVLPRVFGVDAGDAFNPDAPAGGSGVVPGVVVDYAALLKDPALVIHYPKTMRSGILERFADFSTFVSLTNAIREERIKAEAAMGRYTEFITHPELIMNYPQPVRAEIYSCFEDYRAIVTAVTAARETLTARVASIQEKP